MFHVKTAAAALAAVLLLVACGPAEEPGTPAVPLRAAAATGTGGPADAVPRPPAPVLDAAGAQARFDELLAKHPVSFDLRTGQILAGSEAFLDPVLAILRRNHDLRIRVATSAKLDLSPEDTLEFTQRMAQAVVQWFGDRGIEDDRMVARGYGNVRPVPAETSPEARKTNPHLWIVVVGNL